MASTSAATARRTPISPPVRRPGSASAFNTAALRTTTGSTAAMDRPRRPPGEAAAGPAPGRRDRAPGAAPRRCRPTRVKWIAVAAAHVHRTDRGRVAAPGRDHPVEVEDVDPPAAGRGARRRHLAHGGVVEVHPGRRVFGPRRPRGLGPAVVVGRRHEDHRRPLRPQHVDGLPEAARQIAVEGGLADVLPPAPDLLVEGLAACGVHDDVGVVGVDPVPPGGEDGVRIPAVARSARAPPRRPRP